MFANQIPNNTPPTKEEIKEEKDSQSSPSHYEAALMDWVEKQEQFEEEAKQAINHIREKLYHSLTPGLSANTKLALQLIAKKKMLDTQQIAIVCNAIKENDVNIVPGIAELMAVLKLVPLEHRPDICECIKNKLPQWLQSKYYLREFLLMIPNTYRDSVCEVIKDNLVAYTMDANLPQYRAAVLGALFTLLSEKFQIFILDKIALELPSIITSYRDLISVIDPLSTASCEQLFKALGDHLHEIFADEKIESMAVVANILSLEQLKTLIKADKNIFAHINLERHFYGCFAILDVHKLTAILTNIKEANPDLITTLKQFEWALKIAKNEQIAFLQAYQAELTLIIQSKTDLKRLLTVLAPDAQMQLLTLMKDKLRELISTSEDLLLYVIANFNTAKRFSHLASVYSLMHNTALTEDAFISSFIVLYKAQREKQCLTFFKNDFTQTLLNKDKATAATNVIDHCLQKPNHLSAKILYEIIMGKENKNLIPDSTVLKKR